MPDSGSSARRRRWPRAPALAGTLGGPAKVDNETPLAGHFLTGMLAKALDVPADKISLEYPDDQTH